MQDLRASSPASRLLQEMAASDGGLGSDARLEGPFAGKPAPTGAFRQAGSYIEAWRTCFSSSAFNPGSSFS
ncbi:hypothetical protein J2W17_004251 [Pseudomonas lini]|nr:hypothetical protein [Pseudomonas lini]